MMDELIRQLIDFIQNASPAVWAALVRQVYAEALVYFSWGALWVGCSIGTAKAFVKVRKMPFDEYGYFDSESKIWASIGLGILFTILFVFAFGCITQAAMYIYNPEYYAIKSVIDALTPSR